MSQKEWLCKKCTFCASSRSTLRHHDSITHDNDATISSEGKTVTVTRAANGLFVCAGCGNSMKSSRSLIDFHTKCYFPDERAPTVAGTRTQH